MNIAVQFLQIAAISWTKHHIVRGEQAITLYVYRRGEPSSLVLFDNVPGGAGHVKRVADELEGVFKAAFQRVDSDCCGPETSCYECLRNYRNQPYHDELQRGLVRDFLYQVLSAVQYAG